MGEVLGEFFKRTGMSRRIQEQKILNCWKNAVGKGVAVVPWCQARGCAEILEGRTGGSILGTDVGGNLPPEVQGTCIVCGKEGAPTLLARTF